MNSLPRAALESLHCPLCEKDDTRLVGTRRDTLTACREEFRLVRCNGCGLVYVNPRPKLEHMGQFYPPEFVSYQFEPMTRSGHEATRDRLLAWVSRNMATRRISKVRKWLKSGPGTKVLDVGCGKGNFLAQLAREAKCRVTGLDMDEASVRYCREQLGIATIRGSVRALEALPGDYDLVTMWHFLEHEHDPLGALRQAFRCLKPGGYLFVEVPNEASLENRVFGSRSYLYDPPRHLFNFAPATLSALMEKAGFSVLTVRCTASSGGWLGSVQQLVSGGRIYRDLRNHAGSLFALSVLTLPLDCSLSWTRWGSILTVAARKPDNNR